MLKINIMLAAAFMILAVIGQWDGPGAQRQFRKWQLAGLSGHRVLRKQLDARLAAGINRGHRQRVELMLQRAGFKLHYHEFLVICLVSGAAGFFLARAMNNGELALLLPLIGLVLPWQAVRILRYRRQTLVYKYIGTALKMWADRIILTKDITASLEFTAHELAGAEPLYSEFTAALAEIKMGVPLSEALTGLAARVDNRFLNRHIENALLAEQLGTQENRRRLLTVAYLQAEERERNVAELNKQLAAPRLIFLLFVGVIPPLFLFMCWGNPGYFKYLTENDTGRRIMSGAVTGLLAASWFFSKLTAPVDD